MPDLKIQFIPFPVLITGRLILRRLKIADFHEIFVLRSDERVNRYVDRPKIKNLEEAKTFIRRINRGIADGNWIYWAITRKTENILIGTVCLWHLSAKKLKGEIGYELHPEAQGIGIMHEALTKVIEFGFHNINLKCIEAFSHIDNEKSIRVLEKCGFTPEGINKANTREKIYKLIPPAN